jgi:predicted acyltransferase
MPVAWFTPTDLVFPSFMFAVGNAMSFVMKKWVNMNDAAVLVKFLKEPLSFFYWAT